MIFCKSTPLDIWLGPLEVFTPAGGAPFLCASYDFDRLGAFLYEDFFRGLAEYFIPKRCSNCGKWFLIDAGIYSDYCENPLAEDKTKTCRMVSARKKYDTKCKEDPVWNIFNKAYKAHYAWIAKKKMTKAEFEGSTMPMQNLMSMIPKRLMTVLRNWRNICVFCPWKITTRFSICVAACAVHTNARLLSTACNMVLS